VLGIKRITELEKKLRKNATGLVLLGAQQDTKRAAMELRT
jgi:hypothetical protein